MAREPRLNGLPPAGTRIWVAQRKAAVVAAVRRGLISREEAYRRYELSEEELSSWQLSFETYGIEGLRVTYVQQYRGDGASRLATAAPTAAVAAQQGSGAPVEEGLQRWPASDLPVSERI
jgi:hypothetical protein